MKTFLLIFSFILLSFFLKAQENVELFIVLASKGNNKLINSNLAGKPLLIGSKLYLKDKIILSTNGYLALAHKSGKTIELRNAGTYETVKLYNEVQLQNASVKKKYIDFVISEMIDKPEEMAKNHHKYSSVLASVERGPKKINLIAPDNNSENFVLTTPITIRWNSLDIERAYLVRIDNMFGETLFSRQTTDTSIVLDLEKINPVNENTMHILKIHNLQGNLQSDDFSLKYLGGDKGIKIKKEIAALKTELGEETAINKIVLASFFEEHKLLLDAMECYEEAIKLQPEVEDYKVIYGKFLIRSAISQYPK